MPTPKADREVSEKRVRNFYEARQWMRKPRPIVRSANSTASLPGGPLSLIVDPTAFSQCPEQRASLILRTAWSSLVAATFAMATTFACSPESQAPAGLAATALADSSFTWIRRSIPGFRVYFLADSYPAAH